MDAAEVNSWMRAIDTAAENANRNTARLLTAWDERETADDMSEVIAGALVNVAMQLAYQNVVRVAEFYAAHVSPATEPSDE